MKGAIRYLLIDSEHVADGGGVQRRVVKGGGDEGLQGIIEGKLTAGHGKLQLRWNPGFFQEPSHGNPHIVAEGHQEPRNRTLQCEVETYSL